MVISPSHVALPISSARDRRGMSRGLNTHAGGSSPRDERPIVRLRDLLPKALEVLACELEGETPLPAAVKSAHGQIFLFVQRDARVSEMGE